jgi:hypothetical protein
MPAGTEIMIAKEKPNAMTTNKARIFLLEIFLTALVKIPKYYTCPNISELDSQKGSGRIFAFVKVSFGNGIATLPPNIDAIFLFGCLVRQKGRRGLLKRFSELRHNLFIFQSLKLWAVVVHTCLILT